MKFSLRNRPCSTFVWSRKWIVSRAGLQLFQENDALWKALSSGYLGTVHFNLICFAMVLWGCSPVENQVRCRLLTIVQVSRSSRPTEYRCSLEVFRSDEIQNSLVFLAELLDHNTRWFIHHKILMWVMKIGCASIGRLQACIQHFG